MIRQHEWSFQTLTACALHSFSKSGSNVIELHMESCDINCFNNGLRSAERYELSPVQAKAECISEIVKGRKVHFLIATSGLGTAPMG